MKKINPEINRKPFQDPNITGEIEGKSENEKLNLQVSTLSLNTIVKDKIIECPVTKRKFTITAKKLELIQRLKEKTEGIDHENLYLSTEETGLERRLWITKIHGKATAFFCLNKIKDKDPLLGQGSYKKVKYAIDIDTQKVYASLSLKDCDANYLELKNMKSLEKEEGFIHYLAKVIHSKSIKVEDKIETKEKTTVKVEDKKIDDKKKLKYKIRILEELYDTFSLKTPTKEVPSIIYQTAKSLMILHEDYQAVHRDLKHEQLLTRTATPEEKKQHGGNFTSVIGDLGTVCTMLNPQLGKIFSTSIWYASPELVLTYWSTFSENKFTFVSDDNIVRFTKPYLDIWSLGCITYISLTRKLLGWCKKTDKDSSEFLASLRNEWKTLTPEQKEFYLGFTNPAFLKLPKLQQELIRLMLNVDFRERATARQVVEFFEKNAKELLPEKEIVKHIYETHDKS